MANTSKGFVSTARDYEGTADKETGRHGWSWLGEVTVYDNGNDMIMSSRWNHVPSYGY